MKRLTRIAALGAALCLALFMAVGCRNEKQLAENLAAAKQGSEQALAKESGEIMVYTTLRFEKDLDDNYMCSTVSESYAKFAPYDGPEYNLQFDLTETKTFVATGETRTYEETWENGKMTGKDNGESFAPSGDTDILRHFRIGYEVADIESIEVVDAGSGVTLYAVTMTEAYAAGYNSESVEAKCECTKVIHNYYVDASGVLREALAEYTMTVTALSAGEAQTVTYFIQATLE